VTERFGELLPPLLTCEPVLTEAAFLVRRAGGTGGEIPALVRKGVLRVAFAVQQEAAALEALMRRYRNVPMSLADACLVRMSEATDEATVFTLDADFGIYRRRGRMVIPTLMP
jgi:predicted nucleic acid-binding protein